MHRPHHPQPRLADVLEHNIRTLLQLRERAAAARGLQDHLADLITTFSGRMAFVYLHVAWFGA